MPITEISQVEELETMPIEIDYKEKVEIKKKQKAYTKFGKFVKRAIDIFGAIIGCAFLIPITITLFVIKIFSKNKNKIFYTQERIGKDGKIFKLYKYQTMIPNADEYLFKYLEENEDARKEYTKNKKLKYDPRVTKIGNVLRKTSIDEFPQFINVLKGDMSLVGPRPYLLREKEEMGESYNNIIKTRPGITGPWQVGGRSDLSFNERLNIESKYSDNATFFGDVKILLKTVSVAFNKKGAV